jgi:hypothetical protein
MTFRGVGFGTQPEEFVKARTRGPMVGNGGAVRRPQIVSCDWSVGARRRAHKSIAALRPSHRRCLNTSNDLSLASR